MSHYGIRCMITQDDGHIYIYVNLYHAGIYTQEACTTLFVADLLIVAWIWKQFMHLSTDEQVKKICYIYAVWFLGGLKQLRDPGRTETTTTEWHPIWGSCINIKPVIAWEVILYRKELIAALFFRWALLARGKHSHEKRLPDSI